MREAPRVLFVSVNPFSATSNNGKTFASFFTGYPKASIAQLYFHRELPTSDVCDRYYRITDEDIMENLWRPWTVTGEPVSAVSKSGTPIPQRAHSALKSSPTARLLRQVLWTLIPLSNTRLLAWLDDYCPEIVIFCGGDAAALYPKVAALAERYAAPLVYYVTDDYVLPIPSRNLASRVSRQWTRCVFRRMTSQASLVLTVGTAMSSRYRAEFGFDSLPVMNMVEIAAEQPPLPKGGGQPLTLLFAGSLHTRRWTVLSQVADSVERLANQGIDVVLRVYGPAPDDEALAALTRPPRVEYRGLLKPEELGRAMNEADVLVHVESDDPASMAVTALSVSTKIPEYLAAGRPLLALGPKELASIQYLKDHRAALVATPGDADGIDAAITSLARDPDLRSVLAARGYGLARVNHDGARVRRKLWRQLENVVR